MRVTAVLDRYSLLVAGEGPTAIVAELRHIAPSGWGGRVETPVGVLSAAPIPAEPEMAAHWRADLTLRNDISKDLLDRRLPDAIADWLLQATSCTEPLLLNVHEGRGTSFVQRGRIFDD